jgi:hypothetical protein
MVSSAFAKVSADRLRLRAKLWRRDAESTANGALSQLMLHSAYELEAEAVELEHRGTTPGNVV